MRILRLIFSAVAITSIVAGVLLLAHTVFFKRYVTLGEVEGVSASTLEKAGVTFTVSQPIPQVARGFYAFDVTLLSPQLSGQKVAFYGSGQDLNEMTSAIDFVEKAVALDFAEKALEGFAVRTLDTLKCLGGIIWQAVTSPVQLAEQIGHTVFSVCGYASSVVRGDSNLGADALDLVRNVQREEVEGITAGAGFTYDTCPIPQARELALKLARA